MKLSELKLGAGEADGRCGSLRRRRRGDQLRRRLGSQLYSELHCPSAGAAPPDAQRPAAAPFRAFSSRFRCAFFAGLKCWLHICLRSPSWLKR